jgi:endonuclease-8
MRDALDGAGGKRVVYRHAGRPCPRCGTPIRSRGQGDDNRMAYWCPGCQRGEGPRDA